MSDIETKLRVGLQAFSEETMTQVTTPPVASIALRAAAPKPHVSVRRVRWPKVAAIVVAGAAIGTGVASAVGVLPGSVESKLHEFHSWGFDTTGGATRVAAVTQGDFTYEVWMAPLAGGGQCVYDRVVDRDGRVAHGDADECVITPFPANSFKYLFSHYPQHPGEATVLVGLMPPAAHEVQVDLTDGTSERVEAQPNGWFVAMLPGVSDSGQVGALEALTADGRVLSTIPTQPLARRSNATPTSR
jgi:hypothetical protein